MSSDTAVLTCITKKKYKLYTPALSSVEIYCNTYNLNLEVLKNPIYSGKIFFDKFYFIEMLKKYHRVLVIDSDVLISPKAPNIFDKYNEYDKFYAARNEFDKFNEGVFIVSRAHIDKFKTFQTSSLYTKEKMSLENKDYINKVVKFHGVEVTNIDKKFNYINDSNRLTGYFIHYENTPNKLELMQNDFDQLYS